MVEHSDTNDRNNNSNSEPAQLHIDEPRRDSPVQPVHQDCTQNIDSLPSNKDMFAVAFNDLVRAARENGFSIHDVPYDGDCLTPQPTNWSLLQYAVSTPVH